MRLKLSLIIGIGIGIFLILILLFPTAKQAGKVISRKLGLSPVIRGFLEEKGFIEDKNYISLHQYLVSSLYKALEKSDFKQSAALNSNFAREAFLRAYKNLKAWEKLRDPQTGLVPTGVGPEMAYWNTKNTAADLFPFLLKASLCLDKTNERLWLSTLKNERKISGAMPRTINFQPARVKPENIDEIIYGASEYAKDGLLAVAERFGRGPWFERLEEIMQTLINNAYIKTKRGKICSSGSEVNGEMLQVLTRLYWATRKPEYLEMAERIGEVYLFDILPNTRFLPPAFWDFSKEKPADSLCRLRDHGCEVISGLAELYLLEKKLGRPKAESYREPLKKMLDLLLVVGRNKDGLWCKAVDINTQQLLDRGVIDNWGYILNAYQTFDLAEGTSIYANEIKRYLKTVATSKGFDWEGISHDGFADTLESMLYFLPWFDIPECHRWVDDEIRIMFRKQAPSGFIGRGEELTQRGYLDGNFIRTALLYAAYKTQGTMVAPWREDVYLGAAYDKKKKELYVFFRADSHWEGVLKFDLPRHRIIWNLPFEYPRINESPEWFTVEPNKVYTVKNLKTGEETLHSGGSLAKGLKFTVDENITPFYYLMISEKTG